MTGKSTIDQELRQIETRHHGLLRAEDVVAFARNPRTRLHRCFCWDDTEAARLYRLEQARAVIRVHVAVFPQSDKRVRAWVSLLPDRLKRGGGYRSMASVLSDAARRKQMLADALAELSVLQAKYAGLTELAGVFTEIERVRNGNRKRKTG